MKSLRVLYLAVVVLSVIILFSVTTSFADNGVTQDDIKTLKDSLAIVQKSDPETAKKLSEFTDKVSKPTIQVVPQPVAPAQVQSPSPTASKYMPPSITSTQAKDFWLIDSPKEWPSQIMGGMRGGTEKMKSYSDNLIPFAGTKDAMLFADVKSVFESSNTDEENFGLGARTLLFDEKLILGGNFFYDTKYDKEYDVRNNQLAFGIEGLSKWVDARANFYFPISDKKQISPASSSGGAYLFDSRSLDQIVYTTGATYEEPLTGLDYEGGILIPYLSDYLETRAFIGGYNYFPSVGKGLNGIKGRIEIRPVKAFTINLELKKDNYNPTEFFVEGVVTVPLDTMNVFKITNPLQYLQDYLGYKKGIRPLRERMVDRVVRDIDITSNKTGGKTTQSTTKIHDLTYVDNSYGGTSTGTKEQPYKTIQAGNDGAVGDSWVYVEGSSHTSYAESITLSDNVTLWGSGYNGGFRGLTTSGVYPIIDGTGTNPYGVTLGNNNTVMGLQITGTTTSAIYSTTPNLNATISHNIITLNTGDGIDLFPSSGNLTATITDNTITNNTGYGIDLITTGGGTVTATLANNTETGNNGDGYISDGVTTTDLGTGLIWAADGNGDGCYDGGQLDWADAISYYEGLTFAGKSDWRLPTIQELQSIINYNTYFPAIYAKAFPNTQSFGYWSSTTYASYTVVAWYANIIDGVVNSFGKTVTFYVRGVRGS